MIAYKAFKRGLVSTKDGGDYKQFHEGFNKVSDSAKCVSSGAHCAADPLDMFAYYSPGEDTEYRIVVPRGDIHEDGTDSKIACTEIEVRQELTIEQVAAAALIYMKNHPLRCRDYDLPGYFKIRCGERPTASGKLGEWLCFVESDTTVRRIGMIKVDGERVLPGKTYNIDGKEVTGNGRRKIQSAGT